MTDATYATVIDAVFAMNAYEHDSDTGLWSDDLGAFFTGLYAGQLGDYSLEAVSTGVENRTNNFFAIAYRSSAGQTIISYRGTTNPSLDAPNGYGIANGIPTGPDATNAIAFYQEVADLLDDPWQSPSDITVVGHSLGGGLAGFVGAIYGLHGDLFDNMPFNNAADHAYTATFPSVTNGSAEERVEIPGNAALAAEIYGSGTPYSNNLSGLKAYQTTGQFLGALTLFQAPTNEALNAYAGPQSIFDLHDIALLTMLLYADVSKETAWQSIGRELFSALFNNSLGAAIGGRDSHGNTFTAAQMRTIIAYSALNSGYEPFGTTAIQSLYNDADTLGAIQSAGEFKGFVATTILPLTSSVGALAEIAVQFAGDQAAAANTDQDLAQGAFELDGAVLKADLDPLEWSSTFRNADPDSTKTSIVGVGDLFNAVLVNVATGVSATDPTHSWVESNTAGLSASLLKQLNQITEIDIALDGGDLSAAGTLPAAHNGSAGGAMLIGGNGQGSITGSDKGNDIIVGGATVTTGDGKDIILAGGSETITVGKGNNLILADSSSMNVTLTYAGGAVGASSGSGYGGESGGGPTTTPSAGTDVIIGNSAGGDTFTFTNADLAAFTVVWAGSGNDTFNINTQTSSANVDVVEMDMSGISGGNLANLNATALETYVDQTYGLSANDPTLVILNPSSSDTLTYNGKTIDTPAATLGSTSWENNDYGGYSNDPNVINDETGGYPIGPDPKNPLLYLTQQKVDTYAQQAHDSAYAASLSYWYGFLSGLGLDGEDAAKESLEFATGDAAVAYLNTIIDIGNYEAHNLMLTNTWVEESQKSTNYVLASANFEFSYSYSSASTREVNLQPIVRKITNSGGYSDPTSVLQAHIAGGATSYLTSTGGGLSLINYNPGDFGIGVPQDSSQGTASQKSAVYEVLQGWAKITTQAISSTTTIIIGTSPAQLGAVISNYNAPNTPTNLYDPGFTDASHNRQTVSISQFLSGSSASDPTNVSAQFFAANQALLDGQYYGFTVLDTAANVSDAFDELNEDSKLTGITLTDTGTPTLTLTAAQALDDTTALGEISNVNYSIAIADTAADVSQDIDAFNSDTTVSSIHLTDPGTPSLALTAEQLLVDTTALAEISNADYTIAISDTAADVAQTIDVLNGNAAVDSITLTDSGTPVLTLTVAQALGDTTALGEITNAAYDITVEDTAANILANASALSSDGHVTEAIVIDTVANVLDNAAALNANAQVASITVVDTAVNLLANLTSIQADAKVTSMVVVDTAANVLANSSALAGVSEITGIGVADTAADVAADIDALNADTSVGWVELTDSGTPTLTLTAAQAVNDTSLLARIGNPAFAVDVADTAAAVAENIDALAEVATLASVTLTDPGTPILTLTAAQAVNDVAVIALISNTNAEIVVSDTAANVVAQLDALNADSKITTITLTDPGTPILTLTVAQLLDDATALGKIDNANVGIVVSDTAVDVSANFDALNTDAVLSSIALTDSGTPMLILTAAQAVDDTGLLAKISNSSYTIAIFDSVADILANASALSSDRQVSSITAIDTVADILGNSAGLASAGSTSQLISDTAANVAANIDAIKADTSIRAISLTDSGTPTLSLTAAQTIDDAAVLAMITNSTFAIDVSGTAADIGANINFLAANSLVGTVTLTDAGVPTLSLDVGEAVGDAAFLAKITNVNYVLDIADTAADVSANLDALNANTAIAAITLTDVGTPQLGLSVAQALGDTNVLGLITNSSYTVAITDTVANVVANAAALAADSHVSSISIVDTAANLLADDASLAGNLLVTSITVVDTAANILADRGALANISGVTAMDVVDTAAGVTANFDALNADSSISGITLSDAAPVLTLTAEQAANDYSAFYKITNPSYSLVVVDTAANVSQYLGQFAYNQDLTSITLTDSGPATLDLYSYLLGSGVLSKITNTNYTVSLLDPSDVSVYTFVAAQAILDGVAGGFAISDTTADVSAQIDALNNDTHLTSITLIDWETPNLALSATQVVNDTQALSKITNSSFTISVTGSAGDIVADSGAFTANGRITSITVQDTAANVVSNAVALESNSNVAAIVVVDTAANVLANEAALDALTAPVTVNVEDTAAEVSALIDQLNADTSLSSIALTDATNPTLSLTAAQAVNDSIALGAIAGPLPYVPATYGIAIVDTAANVVQYLDALSSVSQASHISSISLTDAQHLSLTLDATEVLNGAVLLSLLSNATYSVAIVDTAANIESNIDSLNADPNISSITVQDATVITVTAEQAVQDAAVLGKLVNATVNVVNTADISVGEFLSEQSVIASIGANFSVRDTAANVSDNLVALNADPNLSTITLSDAGVPTLTLTAAQALGSGVALGAITNPSYTIAITDSAATIGADFTQLGTLPQLSSITLSDPNDSIPLTISELATAGAFLGKITNWDGDIAISDTTANVAADLDTLNGDPRVTSIFLIDAGIADMDLTVAQVLGDTTALGKITDAPQGIVIEDTVDNIAANIDALSAISQIREIAAYIPGEGSAPLPLTVDEAMRNRLLLNQGSEGGLGTGLLAVPVAIVDSAANVAAALDLLNRDIGLTSITLTDSGTPILDLTVAQAANDTTALGKIVGSYSINIVPAGTTVSVANFLANQSTLDAGGYFTISDQSRAVSQAFDSLNADWHVTAITITDGMPLTLTAAQALNDNYALGAVGNVPIVVADTAADISDNFDALVRDTSVSSLTLTDAGTPTLTLTTAQLFDDRQLFGEITNPQYQIAIVDTADAVAASLANIDANPAVTSITLTGSDPLALWIDDWANYPSVISKITNPDLSITILVAPFDAAELSTELDTLNSDPQISSIELLFTPTLTLTVGQAFGNFSKFTGSYTVEIKDSTANIAGQFAALNGDANISLIDFTDSGVPTLVLTAAQVQNDTNALSKIGGEPYVLSIVGTGSENINIGQPLQLSNFAYDATNGDWQVDGYDMADKLTNVASVVDSSGQRYLLVGGGSEYATADAAVAAASNGDIILLTPGSDAGSVGTDGKTITVEDVSAVSGTPPNVPPMVTITSPAVVTAIASDSIFGSDTITGAVVGYGTAVVAGQTVTLIDNGNAFATATVQADGTFTAYVTFAYEGANSIVASVTDSFGNTGTSAPVVDLLDDIAPTVTITSAAETSAVATQTITGTVVSGGLATVAGPNAVLFDNGNVLSAITVQADGSFSVTVTLPDQGTNSLVVSTADSYGNFAESAPLVDTLDSESPTLSILTASQNTTNASLYITGVDSALGQTATFTDNGTVIGSAVSGSYGFFSTYVTLSEGANSIVASVVDDNGNTITSDPVVYTLDDVAPTVTFTSAAESSNVAAQTITGTVASGGAALVVGQAVTLTDNGTTLATATVQADGTFSAALTLPFDGTNTIVASVTDSFGNTGNSTVVDTLASNAAPTVTITSSAEAGNSANQTITGTAVSTGAATVAGQTVTLTDNGRTLGTTTVQADGYFSANVTLPNQGANAIVASVTDSDDNTGSSPAVVDTLDNIAPTITITAAAEASNVAAQTVAGTVTSGGTATVAGQTVTVTDNGTTLGSTTVQSDGTFSVNVTLPNQGANSIVATVTDSYGNASSSAVVADTLDDVAPTVTITTAVEASDVAAQTISGTVASGGAATVAGQAVTLTDNGTTLGTTTVQADGTFSANVTLPNQGANSIVATVTDGFGNTGSSAALVDTLNDMTPTVTIASEVLAEDTGASSTDYVTGDGQITLTGTASVGLTVAIFDGGQDIGNATVSGPDWTFSTDLGAGTHQLVAVGFESGGSTISSVAAPTVVVDQTIPQPVIANVAQGQNSSLLLNGSSEANSVVQIFDGTTLVGSATTNASGTWSLATGPMTDTLHSFTATATDLAGNTGSTDVVFQYGGSGIDTVNIAATLQASSFVYDAANAEWDVDASGVAESLTDVEVVVDGAGHRFLLVGAGSQYTTIQQAVNAASDGDTILIAPGNYTEDVTIAGKAISLEGFGGTTLHGSITESGTLNGALSIDGISIDATGQQYGVLVSANSTNYAGSVTIENSSITNAELNGFAYIENGNGSTPTLTDTIGSISILDSLFSGNATQTSGANGRGDILLYGYNGNFTINGVTIQDPGAGAQKAIQLRGVQTSINTVNVGPYQPGGNISLTNLSVSGTYSQDLLAFYRYAQLGSFSASGVTLDAAAPWGLLNFDEVGGTIDLSSGITATDLASGAPIAAEQGIGSNSTFVGTSGNDVLVANGGNDTLIGGAGTNIYVYSSSGGNDVINDAGTRSELIFTDIASTGVTVSRGGGNDLVVTVTATGKTVTISGQLSGSTTGVLQSLNFSDGVVWTAAQVTESLSPPVVRITSAAEASNVVVQTISGTVVSGGAAVVVGQTVTLTDNGANLGTATVQADGSFTANLTLPNQGTNSIVAMVTDSYGNAGSSAAVADVLDTIAPTVTIASAAETGDVAAQTIAGTVVSGGAAVVVGRTVTLTDNGTMLGTATVQANGSFTANVTLPNQGTNSIVATVTDSYGNTGSSAAVVDTLEETNGYYFVTGQGQVTVNASVGTVIMGAGVTAGDVDLQANSSGDLTISVAGDTTDSAVILGDLSYYQGVVRSALSQIQLGDGTVLNLEHNPLTFTWLGNSSNYNLTGSDFGANQFDITNTGSITLGNTYDGGNGQSTIDYSQGSGRLAISLNGGTGILELGSGITASDVYLQSDNSGDLTVGFMGDTTDSIAINSDLTVWEGVMSSGLSQIEFSDGTALNLDQGPLTFTWLGSSSGYNLTGSNYGANLFDITKAGSITFGNASDGGNGQNTIDYSAGSGRLNVALNGGTGILELGSGITVGDVYLQSDNSGDLTVGFKDDTTDSIAINGDLTVWEGVMSSGLSRIQFSDGTVLNLDQGPLTFTWLGNSSGYNLTGSNYGANLFDVTNAGSITFGNGNDGGNGQNTIDYSAGSGRLNVALNGGTGILELGSGINAGDVNVQSDNSGNLTITFNGDATDSIAIDGDVTEWEGVVSSGLRQIQFSDGTVVNTLDAFAPTIGITSVAEASNVATQIISGTVAPSGTAAVAGQTVTLTDNGATIGTATVQSNGTFSASVTLADQGSNSIVAKVVDSLGFAGSSAAVVDTLDNVAPTVTITSAESSNVAAQTIRGTVVSNGAATVAGQTVTLTDNGTALATTTVQADGTFAVAVTLPNEGANSIVATVSDSYGNTGSSAAAVDTLNDDAPTVTITSSAVASNNSNQTIAGTVVAQGTASVVGQTVTITDNGTALTTATVQADGTFTINVTLPNQGANVIVANVTDSEGNTGSSAALTDTIDSLDPTVAISSAAEASDLATQTISGRAISGGAATVVGQTVTLTDNGTALGTATVQADGTFTANVTLPNQGTNAIVATVTDSDGNIGSSAAVVDTLDNVAPTVIITSAVEASNNPTQTITGTVASAGAAKVAGQTVTLTDNGAALGTATIQADGSFSATVTLPNEGANSIVATATDSYGNTGESAAVTDTLNQSAPTVGIASEVLADDTGASSTDYVTSDGQVTLAGNVSAGSTVAIYDGATDLGAATISGTSWSFSTDLGQGTHQLEAVATDSSGSTATSASAAIIVVDDTSPQIANIDTVPFIEGTDIFWTISGTSEPGSTVQFFEGTTVEGTAVVNGAGVWTMDASNSDPHTTSESFVATDLAGNVGTYNVPLQDFAAVAFYAPTSNGGYVAGGAGGLEIPWQQYNITTVYVGAPASGVYFEANGYGDLTVNIGDSDDSAVLADDLTDQSGLVASGVHQLQFSDGTLLNLGGPMTFTWLGNANNYNLAGSNFGSNIFDITTGNGSITFGNSSQGGNGQNTIEFDKGDGQASVNLNGGTGTVDFGSDISAGDVYWEANGYGDLVLQIRGDSADSIDIHDDLTDHSGSVVSGLGQLQFTDGSTIYLGQGSSLGGPLTFTWFGGSNNYNLTGSNFGSNLFDITAGNGSITFGNSSQGGSGQNTIEFDEGDGQASVNLNGGTGTVDFGSDISSSDVYWQADGYGNLFLRILGDNADSISIGDDLTDNSGTVTSGIGQLQFSDGTVIYLGQGSSQGEPLTFTWFGNANNYNLTGSSYGSNLFDITTGNGSITFGNSNHGGSGTNTIEFGLGDGAASVNLNGGTGSVDFGAGISSDDVYWQADGYGNLFLRILGDNADSISIGDDLTNNAGTVTSGLNQLEFNDGTVVNLGGPMTFTWLGNANNYNLTGSNYGSNVFDITTGNGSISFGNSSHGGSGTNTIEFGPGDGIASVNLNGGTGSVDFGAGISSGDVYWQADGYGNLFLRILGDNADSISIGDDLTNNAGTVTSGLNQLEFNDGTVVNLGGPMTFTWLGNANNYNLTGSNYGSNVFDITTGNGSINFGNSSQGGSGTNTIDFAEGDGSLNVNQNNGTGSIDFGTGVSANDVYLQANGYGDLIVQIVGDTADSITIHNDLTDTNGTVTSSISQLGFSDGSVVNINPASGGSLAFTWQGTPNASMSGSNFGANVFEFGQGSESATGGSTGSGGTGSNTYIASTNTGQAYITPNEAAGTSNELDFAGGITDDRLWFAQSGNDLKIDLIGTNTQVTVADWFGSSSNQLQEITAGGLKLDSQVSQLVQAMATYSGNNPGFNPTSSSISAAPSDTGLQNAIAAAWHS